MSREYSGVVYKSVAYTTQGPRQEGDRKQRHEKLCTGGLRTQPQKQGGGRRKSAPKAQHRGAQQPAKARPGQPRAGEGQPRDQQTQEDSGHGPAAATARQQPGRARRAPTNRPAANHGPRTSEAQAKAEQEDTKDQQRAQHQGTPPTKREPMRRVDHASLWKARSQQIRNKPLLKYGYP